MIVRHANPHIEFAIATGMGQARNAIVVASADAVVALAGEGGTLSEIGLATQTQPSGRCASRMARVNRIGAMRPRHRRGGLLWLSMLAAADGS